MSDQELPGMGATETRLTGEKLANVLLDTGAQIALDNLHASLMEAKRQYPAAVGLAMAIAFVERDKAAATLKTTRVILAAAAKARMDFDGKVLSSGLERGELVIRVTPEPPEGART